MLSGTSFLLLWLFGGAMLGKCSVSCYADAGVTVKHLLSMAYPLLLLRGISIRKAVLAAAFKKPLPDQVRSKSYLTASRHFAKS